MHGFHCRQLQSMAINAIIDKFTFHKTAELYRMQAKRVSNISKKGLGIYLGIGPTLTILPIL